MDIFALKKLTGGFWSITLALAPPALPADPGDGNWGEVLPVAPVLTAKSLKAFIMSSSTLSVIDSPALLDALEGGTDAVVVTGWACG